MKKTRKRRPRKWVVKVVNPSERLLRILAPTKIQKLSASADDPLGQLSALVMKGSAEAAQELHYTVAAAVQNLKWLCKKKPELFAPIASKKLSWPVMYSLHPESATRTKDFLRELQLARETNINISSGKTFSWRTPANAIAVNLHRLARDVREPGLDLLKESPNSIAQCGVGVRGKEEDPKAFIHVFDNHYKDQLRELEKWGRQGSGHTLPALSKATASQWSTAGDELFQIAYGRETFETHPYLRPLRESVIGRAKNAYGQITRGAIRKAMRQAVKQAWHSISAVD